MARTMNWSIKKIRLRSVWLLIPAFLILAEPAPSTIAAGLVLAIAGGLVRAWASGTIHKNRILTTGGPYAYTRNPLYLGTFLTGLGLTIAAGSLPLVAIFLAFFGTIYVPTMWAEEKTLDKLFGEAFHVYADNVPLFIPRLRPYRPLEPHATEFMMRRYFSHKEYEFALGVSAGFLALIAKMLFF